MRRSLQVVLSLILCCASATAPNADEKKPKEKKKSESFMASAMVTSGAAGGSVVSLTITIDSFTSDEEILQLAQILKDKGPDALAKALDKTKRGRISPVGRVGNDINVARTFQTEKGRVIRLALNRPIGFLELRQGGRSRDYQFGLLELVVDEKGTGSGSLLAAAKIKFNEKNQLEVEQYGRDPVRLTNVRRF